MNDAFYKTTRWKKLRDRILRRDGYKCQLSARFGRNIQADTVHHIFPREQFPEYQYEPWNLVSVSARMHDRLHDRNTNQLTREGMELLERTARRQGIDVHTHDG